MTTPRNIVLVGFMGSGKSAVGRALAARLGHEFLDLDALIEERAGRAITAIFASDGEAGFRDAETAALCSLTGRAGLVVATGGGVVLREENWPLMHALGPVVYLAADAATLYARLCPELAHRPLLASEPDPEAKIARMLAERAPAYARADVSVATDGLASEAVAEAVAGALRLAR